MKREIFHIMTELQTMQFNHDVKAHRDLLSFDIYSKIKHMTLHFSKYAGKIQASIIENNKIIIEKSLIDTFIICMATANALNKNLGTFLESPSKISYESIEDYLNKIEDKKSVEEFLICLVINTGNLAKAIESTDHMEFGNPRKDIENALGEIFVNTVKTISFLKIEIFKEIIERFNFIENKQIIKI